MDNYQAINNKDPTQYKVQQALNKSNNTGNEKLKQGGSNPAAHPGR